MILEIVKFIIYSGLIVIISKYILVKTLRKLAESLNLKAKTVILNRFLIALTIQNHRYNNRPSASRINNIRL